MIVDRSCASREPRSASARSLIFAFPDPAMQVKKPPPLDKTQPFKDVGLRRVKGNADGSDLQIAEVETHDGRILGQHEDESRSRRVSVTINQ
jgi:hypothetical protein